MDKLFADTAQQEENDMPALTPDSGILYPKTAVSDGQFILFTPGNPGYVVIEGGGGSGTLPTSDAADGVIGSLIPTDAMLVAGENPSGETEPLQVDANNELITSSIGLSLNATGQTAVGYASAGLIIAANAARAGVLITNPSTTVSVYLGKSNVTTSTGAILGPGNSISIPTTSALYGIVASGTQNLSFLELV